MADRRSLNVIKKMYKKHHIVRGTLVDVLPHAKYMKIVYRSTTKCIFESFWATYEGDQQVKEAKANQLVHQSELFIMKEGEDIEAMYSRFQTLIFGLRF